MKILRSLRATKKILGMNARNLEFVRTSNSKPARQIADNKLLAKRVLRKAGLPVPKTYKVISTVRKLKNFDPGDLPKSFVLKPNRGLGGEGILLTYNKRKNGAWLDSGLNEVSWLDIKSHIQDILDGRFSLANKPDIAFFEERLVKESMFKHLAYRGVPDIRLIVYNKVPVMAMMRLPTKESHGKANLHLGGIGVGIDIATGVTTYAICRDKFIVGKQSYTGIKIPEWDQILAMGIQAQEISNLGYLGLDVVLAKNAGPVILELNARPGLSIQIANLTPLQERLMRVRGLEVDSIERGIRLAKDLFGGKQHEPDVEIDSSLIKVIETVSIYHKDDHAQRETVKSKIDSGARSSSMDYELGRLLGYGDAVDYIKSFGLDRQMSTEKAKATLRKIKKEIKFHPDISNVKLIHSATGSTVRVTVKVKFELKGKVIQSDLNLISRERLTYRMIIGRRDLEGFLIKPRQ